MDVKSSDFEVFEALAIDSQTTNLPNSPLTATDVSGISDESLTHYYVSYFPLPYIITYFFACCINS